MFFLKSSAVTALVNLHVLYDLVVIYEVKLTHKYPLLF